MGSKTIVISGGTSGIGLAGARLLAARGHRLILIGRSEEKGRSAIASLAPMASGQHLFIAADLSLISHVHAVVAELNAHQYPIHVLVNNVGTWFKDRQLTTEGIERTIATNHLSYVALSYGLKSLLMSAPAPRVINTTSFVYRQARFDPMNFQAEKSYGTNKTYVASKLYNIMFTRTLAKLWINDGITVNCFSPGFVATEFGRGEGGVLEPYYRFIRIFGTKPEKAAEALVRLADDETIADISGAYFEKGKIRDTRTAATDAECIALMKWSQEMTGCVP